jgi:hypothetical protein
MMVVLAEKKTVVVAAAVPTREVMCAPAVGSEMRVWGGGREEVNEMVEGGDYEKGKERMGAEPYLISEGQESRPTNSDRLAKDGRAEPEHSCEKWGSAGIGDGEPEQRLCCTTAQDTQLQAKRRLARRASGRITRWSPASMSMRQGAAQGQLGPRKAG